MSCNILRDYMHARLIYILKIFQFHNFKYPSNCDVLSGLLELFAKDRFVTICKYHEFLNIKIIILSIFFYRKTCKTTIFP